MEQIQHTDCPVRVAVIIPESSTFEKEQSLALYTNAAFILLFHKKILKTPDVQIFALEDIREVLNNSFQKVVTIQAENRLLYFQKQDVLQAIEQTNYHPIEESIHPKDYIINSLIDFSNKPSSFSIIYFLGHGGGDCDLTYKEFLNSISNRACKDFLILNDNNTGSFLTQYIYAFNVHKSLNLSQKSFQAIKGISLKHIIDFDFCRASQILKLVKSIDFSQLLMYKRFTGFHDLLNNCLLFGTNQHFNFSTVDEIKKSEYYDFMIQNYQSEKDTPLEDYIIKDYIRPPQIFEDTKRLTTDQFIGAINFFTQIKLNDLNMVNDFKELCSFLNYFQGFDPLKIQKDIQEFLEEIIDIQNSNSQPIDFPRIASIDQEVLQFLDEYKLPLDINISTISNSFNFASSFYYSPLTINGESKCYGTPFITKALMTFYLLLSKSEKPSIKSFLKSLSGTLNGIIKKFDPDMNAMFPAFSSTDNTHDFDMPPFGNINFCSESYFSFNCVQSLFDLHGKFFTSSIDLNSYNFYRSLENSGIFNMLIYSSTTDSTVRVVVKSNAPPKSHR